MNRGHIETSEATRIRPAAEEFIRLALYELDSGGRPATWDELAASVGLSPEVLRDKLNSGKKRDLEEVVRRWADHAEEHPPLSRLVVLDHGDDTELGLGHPMRPHGLRHLC